MRPSVSIGERIYNSIPVQVFLAFVIYALYALVLAVSLIPAVALLALVLRAFAAINWHIDLKHILVLAAAVAVSVYLYFIWGAVWMAFLIRLIMLGVKPGKYPKASLTTLRWLIQGGIHTIAMRSILPYIPVSFFCTLYFRVCGARIGKNVYINSNLVSDAYLLSLEDGVIIGGGAEVSCHIMEREYLILSPIRIGADSLIGTGAYISPGVSIGSRCTIGARCYIRRGVRIPDGSVYTVLSGLPMRQVHDLEKGRSQ